MELSCLCQPEIDSTNCDTGWCPEHEGRAERGREESIEPDLHHGAAQLRVCWPEKCTEKRLQGGLPRKGGPLCSSRRCPQPKWPSQRHSLGQLG